jgi:hypothetical protein
MPRETPSAGLTGVGDASPSVRAVQKGVFRKEGEYWTVGYSRNPFRLKHSKGLGYLAHLLVIPQSNSMCLIWREVHAGPAWTPVKSITLIPSSGSALANYSTFLLFFGAS